MLATSCCGWLVLVADALHLHMSFLQLNGGTKL